MKRFLLKVSIVLTSALALHVFAGSFADGDLDEFYLRFTGGKRGSLIIGTSRAAQGIRPAVMMNVLGGVTSPRIFNYAFTVAHSPFGPAYLRAIEAKLDPSTRNGLFVITVDPWSLSDNVEPDLASGSMPEDELTVGKQWTFTGDPNYEYLVRHAPAGWGSIIGGPLHDMDTMTTLHGDGWLQVRASLDSRSVAKRTEQKEVHYRKEMMPTHRPGSTRMRSLEQLVDLLRPHGRVILVRMPVCEPIARIEEELWPGLNASLEVLAAAHEVPYWDLMPEHGRFTYTDGNHLDTTSARMFSTELAQRIASTGNGAH